MFSFSISPANGFLEIRLNFQHNGKSPRIHRAAYVAPTATISGDVDIGEKTCVLFGAVITSEGGPVRIGSQCVIMENAVIRGTRRFPTWIGDNVLIGPHAHISGSELGNNVFVATGSSIFNGAKVGERSAIRINGIVHIKTILPPDSIVPIGWVALGNPVRILPPTDHDQISLMLTSLNFPQTVFGLDRKPLGETNMPEITRRYTSSLRRHVRDRQARHRRLGDLERPSH
jgi:carbonic anhydrase/acetyltransferase-like protein (isoleucine patch superfamily)